MNEDKITVANEDEFEPLLPEGWTGAEGADIFDPETWGDAATADAQDGAETGSGEDASEESGEPAPATGGNTEAATGEEHSDAPATGSEQGSSEKLRFRVSIDHQARDIEIDPSELPDLYERASAVDRYKKRLSDMENERHTVDDELAEWDAIASNLQYEDRNALRKGVIENTIQNYISEHPGVPEEMARDYVTRQFNGKKSEVQAAKQAAQEKAPARDFKAEVAELFAAYPQARGKELPEEVTNAVLNDGKPLVQAYAEYAAKKAEAEAENARKENRILKQNQASAAKAPVSKVSGGGKTDTSSEDAFLRGFNSEDW